MNSQLESSTSAVPPEREAKALELLPAKQVVAAEEVAVAGDGDVGGSQSEINKAEVPKLFGVSIGVKRCRREGEEATSEKDELNQTQSSQEPDRGSDVKSEPLDGNNSEDQEPPWLELGK